MPSDKTPSIILLVVGAGLFVGSSLADVIGFGDDPGFGYQQTVGAIFGAVITAVGLYFTFRKS